MKILFIGGTGIISSACSDLAVAQGHDLTILNRGQTDRPVPSGATLIHSDIRDLSATAAALGDRTFDVVVNWVAYAPEHIETDLALFSSRTAQYVFISSASAYQKPIPFPIVEETPLSNPLWGYSQQKIACEQTLMHAYEESRFPVTIVRPSHTYDKRSIPFHGRWTFVDRIQRGRPIIIHGDGTSLWTLTHHRDFAVGFCGLLGNPQAIGEAIHITSDEWLTWDAIAGLFGAAVGMEPEIVHVPSDTINRYDADWGVSLLADKAHTTVFDNAKIKRLVPEYDAQIPFAEGAVEIVNWYNANPQAKQINESYNELVDRIIAAQLAI
ncbi:MAG: SDR family oxidoreductase [Chloroflexota bacterium]